MTKEVALEVKQLKICSFGLIKFVRPFVASTALYL